ncbi:hypothetical protein [Flavobacterium sp. SM2513]|uniref:hypothetical protein n=1 Tax=Flavobacterium sp. SM2513 TaxID=3424766 RepID=UPI003D7F8708
MGAKITLPFLLLFFTTIGIAQTRRQVQGKISVSNASPSNVLILNLNTEEEARSNSEGLFVISVQPDDILVFSSENLDYMRKLIEVSDYQKSEITIEMTSKLIVLNEVEIIDNKSYNAVDLGILQKPAKSYTPMERKLQTAGDFKPIHLLGLLGGSLQLDPIFNAINGKTKRLKKEIILERNARRLEEFNEFLTENDLIKEVKVSPDNVSEFVYFVLEKEEFKKLLESKDRSKMIFYLIEQHSEFTIKANSDEKK